MNRDWLPVDALAPIVLWINWIQPSQEALCRHQGSVATRRSDIQFLISAEESIRVGISCKAGERGHRFQSLNLINYVRRYTIHISYRMTITMYYHNQCLLVIPAEEPGVSVSRLFP